MSNVYSLLPKLTVNRTFLENFISAQEPCFAIGMTEERKQKLGLLALRPGVAIPNEITAQGFSFGHSLLGNDSYEIVHFGFEFYGFGTYNVLLNPNNLIVQSVLNTMIESGEYFFLAIGPDNDVTTFRSEVAGDNLLYLKENWVRIRHSTTNDVQYQKGLRSFQKHPDPPGQLLTWVCRDNTEYLDLTTDRLEMTPATPAVADTLEGQRRAIAERLDSKVNDFIRAGAGDDIALLTHMASEMPLFKRLIDMGEMNDLVEAYPGFYRFAKVLERLALGIQSGKIKVPR